MDKEESLKKVLKEANKGNPPGQEYTLIEKDDTFEFECQRCGACCMYREDIIINAWDVYNASKALGITPLEFLKKYTIQTLGGFSRLPLIMLGHRDNGMCHFLKFDYMDSGLYKCTINDNKPGACASHPLGIITQYDKDAKSIGANKFIKVGQCPNSKRPVKQNVKDWMRHYTDHIDEFNAAHAFIGMYTQHEDFRKWYFLSIMCMALSARGKKDPEQNATVQAFEKSCDLIMYYTYANYDTSQPFVPQAEKNLKDLNDFLKTNDEIIISIEKVINDLLKSVNVTVKKLIEMNDANDGPKIDIGKLAMLTAANINFKDDDKGGEE